MIDEPAGNCLLERDIPGADAPVKSPRRNTHEAEYDEQGFPGFCRGSGDVDDFVVGRARRQTDRAAKATAAAAHMTIRGAAHGLDRDERRAIDHPHPSIVGPARQSPGLLIDAEMHRREFGEHAEDAIHGTEVACLLYTSPSP